MMKRNGMTAFLATSLLVLVACGGAGNNPGGGGGSNADLYNISLPLPSATTLPGKPVSNFIARPSLAIGPDGGSLTSEDGLLTLTVPQGAVSDLTNFGIQLISNAVPGGVGLAYRVTAKQWSGDPNRDVPLLRPLELTLELRPDQLEGIASEDLLMAYQGSDGRWQVSTPQTQPASLGGVAAQNTGVKLKAQVRRPGDYVAAARYKIYPRQRSVRVGARLTLTVLKISPAAPDAGSGYNLAEITGFPATGWAVQGVPGGSAALGVLVNQDKESARDYVAPKSPPRPNPVRITAQVSDGGRTVTLASSVRVVDSQGWIEFAAFVSANRTDRNGGQLSVDAFAENAFDVTGAQGFVSSEGGSVRFEAKPRPDGFARAKVMYQLDQETDCVCTPNAGKTRRQIEYSFQASGEPRLVLSGPVSLDATINPGGTYMLFPPGNGLGLDGEYTYSFKEVYPCGDRQAQPEKKIKGTDTFIFQSWINASSEALEGKLDAADLAGIQRMMGTGTLRIKATLPGKELRFGEEIGVTIPNWFLKFDTLGAQGQLQALGGTPDLDTHRNRLALLQSRVHRLQPEGQTAAPESLSRWLDFPGLESQPNPRFAACKAPEAPTVRHPTRSVSSQ